MIAAAPAAAPLLARFAGVYLDDSTVVALPDVLADVWRGNGGSCGSQAAVKLHVRWDWVSGALQGPWPVPGRSHDQRSPLPARALPPGSLRLADLGYFDLATLADLDRAGVYWLTRLQSSTGVTDDTGQRRRLSDLLGGHTGATLDLDVEVGPKRLPARLLAVRLPPADAERRRRRLRNEARDRGQTITAERLALADWNYWITNVPREILTLDEAVAVARVRWQLELLFKLWKQHGRLGHSRSRQPWRVLCEVYAKLLALVVQHWLLLTSGWQRLDRSLVKAAAAVRKFALPLLLAYRHPDRLAELVAVLARCIASSYVNRRRSRPPTFRLLQGTKLYA